MSDIAAQLLGAQLPVGEAQAALIRGLSDEIADVQRGQSLGARS